MPGIQWALIILRMAERGLRRGLPDTKGPASPHLVHKLPSAPSHLRSRWSRPRNLGKRHMNLQLPTLVPCLTPSFLPSSHFPFPPPTSGLLSVEKMSCWLEGTGWLLPVFLQLQEGHELVLPFLSLDKTEAFLRSLLNSELN